jgi:hypothetical protein
MYNILEIIIIILAGLGSIAYLARYFFISSRANNQCSGCGGCGNSKKEIFSKILKDDKNRQIKKAGEKHPAARL